ncbi:unnamed protein product, partial [Didymodactylos carnosus]
RCVSLHPNDADFHFLLADAYQEIGQYDRCLSACTRAVELSSNIDHMILQVDTVIRLEKIRRSERLLNDGTYTKGPTYTIDEITAMCERILKLIPTDHEQIPETHYKLSEMYLLRGHYNAARDHWREARKNAAPDVRLPCFEPVDHDRYLNVNAWMKEYYGKILSSDSNMVDGSTEKIKLVVKDRMEYETIDDVRKTINVINSHSGSNFTALLKQGIDSGDEILREHVERGPKNAFYTTLLVQNEIIDCIHKYILNEILHRVENCLFSIIVDETTAEQLSLSLRYYDKKKNDIREDFLTPIETVSCTGETIANIILDYLTMHNLPFDNCVGKAYNGGSNMAGIYRGCQALIKQKCPDAEYYHCSNHCLNLALVDSCSISQIRNVMGNNQENN